MALPPLPVFVDAVNGVGGTLINAAAMNAIVQNIQALGGGGGAVGITCRVTQANHGFSVGQVVRESAGAYALARADVAANADGYVGVVTAVEDANTFTWQMGGYAVLSGLNLTPNTTYWLDTMTAGNIVTTKPATSQNIAVRVLRAISATVVIIYPPDLQVVQVAGVDYLAPSPILSALAALANAGGYLTNNGSGGLSWGSGQALQGGTMTGPIDMNGYGINSMADPVNAQDAATKNWCVNHLLQLSGAVGMAGPLNMENYRILGLGTPVNSTDAATMGFAEGTYSAGTNGYLKLPSGLILQWGMTTFTSPSLGIVYTNTVTLPLAFPGGALGIWTAWDGYDHPADNACSAAFASLSQIYVSYEVQGISDGTADVWWFALGD